MEELIQAVSTVGFPIVAYGGMFWYMIKMQEAHKEEMNALKDSLNQNTVALTELKDVISFLNKGKDDEQNS